MPVVPITPDDADELVRLRDEADRQQKIFDRLTPPARLDYYRKLLVLRRQGATDVELAAALGVTKARPGQLLAQARAAFGVDGDDPQV